MKKNDLVVVLFITIIVSFLCGSGIAYVIILGQKGMIKDTQSGVSTSIRYDEDLSISEGVSNVYDSVVVIEGFSKDKMSSTGTGFIYKKDGEKAYIMTNHHVIGDCDSVKVVLSDKTEISAKIMGSEKYSDIAVLSVDSSKIKQVAKIGNSDKLKVGDIMFTVGSPQGVDYAGTVTKGILSGKDRMVEVALTSESTSDYYMKVLQTDAAINPGNSGGPICNIEGEVVGITNMKLVDSTVEGMGFAISIEDATNYANILEKGDKIKRPFIGISMLDVSNSFYLWQNRIQIPSNVTSGVVVFEVSKDSPADKAELKKGDIIIKINKKEIKSVAEFRYELYKYEADDEITITYIRDGKENKVKVKLSENKDK